MKLKPENKIVASLLDKMLEEVEQKLDLSGIMPGSKYNWDKEAILKVILSQIQDAIKL